MSSPRPLPFRVVVGGLAALALASCTGERQGHGPGSDEALQSIQAALFTNGDFETDSAGAVPTGWTVQTYKDPTITDTRPSAQTLSSLNLASGGYAATFIVGGATESQIDPDLTSASTLRFPKYGSRAARLNYGGSSASTNGSNQNVNALRQTMTIANGDVDTADNKAHVRFAVAPVLQNPGHNYTEQPYYFVRLQNVTRGTTLYQDFNASAQPGVPWKIDNGNYYTDWQLVDIAPGNAALAVGDQVELLVIASGCSLGGHWGRVYVDGIGSTVPGIYTYATGPTSANTGSNITYTVFYKNGGTGSASNTKLDTVIPTGTTFQSVSIPGACTTPAIGGTGTVSCTLGSLAAGGGGSFTLTVKITGASGTTITNGNYYIYAAGVNALLGPKVMTNVTSGVTYADVAITKSNGAGAVAWGQAVTYTITASNAGPANAPTVSIADTMPPQLSGVTWTCTGAAGGSCTAASGSGNIASTVNLPVGASATYIVSGTIISGSGSGSIVNSATATPGGGVSDPDTTNNTGVDSDTIGPLRTVTVTKTGASGGTVASVPASINCGASCTSASGQFADSTSVVLTATAVPGASFTGWGGACASAGASPTCTINISANVSVSAAFVPPPSISVSSGSGQSAAINSAFAAPLKALVVDSMGNPLAGTTVVFSVPASGASATLSAMTAVTNASGIASVTATANGTAGAYVVSAGIMGTAATTTFSLSNYGAPASISVVSGSPQSAKVGTAFAMPLVVVVRDAVSQVVPGAAVSFAAPGSGATASLGATSVTTDVTGQASVTATAGQVAGVYTVTASASGVPTPASFSLTNNAGQAASITVGSGAGQTAGPGAAFGSPLVATVVDSFGNPVSGVVVSFAAPGSGAGAGLSSTTATTDSAGHATVTATANTIAGTYNVTASVSGVATPASFALTNTAGAAASIVATSGSGQSAQTGTAFAAPLVVTVKDGFGNVVPGATIAFSAPGSGASASLGAASASTNGSGQASMTATANGTPGNYTVTASVGGLSVPFSLRNYAPLAIAPTSATVAPRGPKMFSASGGAGSSYTYALTTNASGGSVNSSTGAYTAGSTPNVTDVILVSDGTGATATATVTVGAGLTISPTSASVAPRGSKTFSAAGGSGAGFSYSLTTNGSGGSINPTTGTYTAGGTPNTTDVVSATDSLGNVATATVTVSAGVSLMPASASVAPRGSKMFVAVGGSGTGYGFALTSNGSGGTINASTGAYMAGPTANTNDVVTVTDSLGNTATASISVGGGLSISPSAATVAPRGGKTFAASGGSGSGFSYSLSTNGSGGSINATTGAYTAGPSGNSTDVVKVTDSLGNSATATVTVSGGVTLTPPAASTPPRGSLSLTASGGSGTGFMWSLSTNASGGSVDASGAYTAGGNGGVTDVVTVTDSLGNAATSTITVGAGITIAASGTATPPRGSLTFSASGGAGNGYTYALTTNASNGSIDPVTGAYRAGSKPSVTDVVTVTDPLGNSATVNVAVGAGLVLTPPSSSTPPRGTVNLVASGGSGGGYTYAITSNLSGGSIDPASGVYTAGATGNAVDLITVTDALGNTATASISVGGGLSISPASSNVAPRQSLTFVAAGGSGSGVAFAITTNASGGSVDPASGAYTAGPTGSVSDVVTVTDSLGNSATATIAVGPGIQVAPSSATLAPAGKQSFSVTGGSGNGYTFVLTTNASGGTVKSNTGDYTAGSVGGVTDMITVSDSFGNTATVPVTVTAALQPVVAAIGVAPRGSATLAVTGGAGGYAFAMTVNGSGGSVDPLSGAYVAGPSGNSKDLISVTDQNGVTTVITVNVGSGVSLAPGTPSVSPRGTLTFTASGGSGSGYQYALTTNASGGSIDPSSGAYTAGTSASAVDVVTATDSLGNSATVAISVGGGLVLNPATPTIAPRGQLTFSAFGGSGAGYQYALTSNMSGASIDATSGVYQAGPSPNATDTVKVTDSLGNSASTTVAVGGGVVVSPAMATVSPRGAVALAASGGSGAGYVFTLTANLSGATIEASTGRYVAGAIASVTDTVTVTDSLGNSAVSTIAVGAGITVTAPAISVAPRGTLTVAAAGGGGQYTYSLQSNGSGGSIVSSTGVYTAGSTANSTDVIVVTDSLGNSATYSVAVGPGVSVTPTSPVVPPSGTVTLSASGGSGAGFIFTLTTNGSGGTIDASTGAYTAGATGGTMDVVTVTDSLGNSARVSIAVGTGVTLSPNMPTVAPRATIQFSAAGGTGTGYAYALGTNASGGSIDASTGLYHAGPKANVVDRVTVTDSLGQTAATDVDVGAGLSITPAMTNVAPGATIAFAVSGGSGAGYAFALTANGSGATLNAQTGAYKAGSAGGQTDIIIVSDSLGNAATATISVGASLTVPSGSIDLAPRGTSPISVSGGSGPYHYTITSNGSGGMINPATGQYTAGDKGGTTDVITITDANGLTTTVTVTIGAGLSVGPADPSVSAGNMVTITASGGSGTGYTFRIVDASAGGSIDPTTGVYTAPKSPVPGAKDVVEVTDSNGNKARVTINVIPGLSPTPAAPLHLAGGAGCSCDSGGQSPSGHSTIWGGLGAALAVGLFARRRTRAAVDRVRKTRR